ncbi:MAG: alkaline phosphatase family protein, partial [Sphingobacterium sp.]
FKLLLKKAGLRANLDITPLDANLVKGSHGITEVEEQYYPVYIGQSVTDETCLEATQLKQILLNKIFAK